MKTLSFAMAMPLCIAVLLTSAMAYAGNDESFYELASKTWRHKSDIGFIKNVGQVYDHDKHAVPSVLYKAALSGGDIYISKNGLTFSFYRIKERIKATSNVMLKTVPHEEKVIADIARLDINLEGSLIDISAIVEKEPAGDDVINFIAEGIGEEGLNLKLWQKLTFKQVYPGIDWVVYLNEKTGFKHEFVAYPNADINQIKMQIKGASELSLSGNASVVNIKTPLVTLSEGPLKSFLKETGQAVESKYSLNGAILSFDIPAWKKDKTLIIDPPWSIVLWWSTYYGGSSYEMGEGIAIDIHNNKVYMTGWCDRTGFPILNNGTAYYFSNAGYALSREAVIVVFNLNGVRLWATYYFSTEFDQATDVTTDHIGNIYMVGVTQSSSTSTVKFKTKNAGGFFQGAMNGVQDGFIVKFNVNGQLQWSTFYGGNSLDIMWSVSCNSSNQIFVCGDTQSSNFPIHNGIGGYLDNSLNNSQDPFIAGFSSNTSWLWSTYFGGSSSLEQALSVGFDGNNRICLAGIVGNTVTNFPLLSLAGAYNQSILSGTIDMFIAVFNPTGSQVWCSLYGGNGDDGSGGSNLDVSLGTNRICITGQSTSTNNNFLLNAGGYYQATNSGNSDALIAEFNSNYSLRWATYFGGCGVDGPTGIAVGVNGNIFVTGMTLCDQTMNNCTPPPPYSNNFPVNNPGTPYYYDGLSPCATGQGYSDMFIAHFLSTTAKNWCTFFGLDGTENQPLDMDCSDRYLFITGGWGYDYIPPTQNEFTVNPGGGAYFQPTGPTNNPSDQFDAFIMKFYNEYPQAFKTDETFCNTSLSSIPHIEFYPNPARESISILLAEIQVLENCKIVLTNNAGEIVLTLEADIFNNHSIDLINISSGVYHIQLQNANILKHAIFVKY